jgi:hypothetical protein
MIAKILDEKIHRGILKAMQLLLFSMMQSMMMHSVRGLVA